MQTSVIQTAGKVSHNLVNHSADNADSHEERHEKTEQADGMEGEAMTHNAESSAESPKLDTLTSMAPLQSTSDNQEDTTSTSHQVGSGILSAMHAGQAEASPIAQETLTEQEGKSEVSPVSWLINRISDYPEIE